MEGNSLWVRTVEQTEQNLQRVKTMIAEHYELIGLTLLVALALAPALLTLLAFMDWLRSRLIGAGRRRWLSRAALAADALLLFCLADGWLIEPNRLTVTRITDSSPKMAASTGELRIVHISDVHFEHNTSLTSRVLSTIARESPDIIMLTGDIPQLGEFNRDQLYEWLRKLRRIAPVYAVPGYEDDSLISMSPIGEGALLVSEQMETEARGSRIVIERFGSCGHRDSTHHPTTDGALYIVLDHSPDSIPHAARLKPDWFFCGHTHGGQIRLPFWGAVITGADTGKRYEYGRYRVGEMQAFVTRGIGLEPRPAPQVRFLCPPEIVVLTVRRSARGA